MTAAYTGQVQQTIAQRSEANNKAPTAERAGSDSPSVYHTGKAALPHRTHHGRGGGTYFCSGS